MIITRSDANEKLYGRRVTAKELLNGSVPPPPEADPLYRALGAKFHSLGNTGAMYQKNRDVDGNDRPAFKSTSISKPGTLKGPPPVMNKPQHLTNGYPTTTSTYPQQQPQLPPSPPSSSYQSPSVRKPPPPPPVAPRPVKKEPVARALYAFQGEQEGDLSFQEGDIITVIEKTDSQDDWWTGRIGNRQGVVMYTLVMGLSSQLPNQIAFCVVSCQLRAARITLFLHRIRHSFYIF